MKLHVWALLLWWSPVCSSTSCRRHTWRLRRKTFSFSWERELSLTGGTFCKDKIQSDLDLTICLVSLENVVKLRFIVNLRPIYSSPWILVLKEILLNWDLLLNQELFKLRSLCNKIVLNCIFKVEYWASLFCICIYFISVISNT